jgi:cytochrome P450
MAAGQFLYNFKAAAVRDGTVWSHPDEFDIHRDQNEAPGGTLAFGKGIHYCIGVGVARLVGPIAVSALLRRFPHIGLVPGWQAGWGNVPTFRKLTDLPLRLG